LSSRTVSVTSQMCSIRLLKVGRKAFVEWSDLDRERSLRLRGAGVGGRGEVGMDAGRNDFVALNKEERREGEASAATSSLFFL